MATVPVSTIVLDDTSTTTIRSIREIISVSMVSILNSIAMFYDNGTIDIQILRNLLGASMESIFKSTTMPN